MRTTVSLMVLALAVGGGAPAFAQTAAVPEASRAHPALWPHAATPAAISDARTEAFVTELMAKMTLEEKVG
ncbi:MAG: hypothetical protein ACN4EU_03490, partial [Brevundimonas mediterranea]